MGRPAPKRFRELLVNTALVLGSLLVVLLFCEFGLFRFILIPSDVPKNAFVNGLIRYAPGQTGIWRVRNEIAARYAINRQGWNSGVDDYVVARRPGVARVALVGDSFVEALQVPHDRSMAERLAAELARQGRAVEVYRFGIGGAPLSQYLHMIEREVVLYRPDWIVVLLVHNDFDESFEAVQGRYTSSFLKLRMAGGKVVEEVPPAAWKPGPADWARRTAVARYLYYRWQVHVGAIRHLFLGTAHAASERYQANVDVEAVLRNTPEIAAATDYIFTRMAAVAQRHETRLVLAMDGVRGAIYSNATSPLLALNQLCADLARKHALPFIDLHPVFQAEWNVSHMPFEFSSDGHWNDRGHATAARAVAQEIDPRL